MTAKLTKTLNEHIREDRDFQDETRIFRERLDTFMEGTEKSLGRIETLWDERNEENGARKFKEWLMDGAGALGLVLVGALASHYWP